MFDSWCILVGTFFFFDRFHIASVLFLILKQIYALVLGIYQVFSKYLLNG